MDVIFMEKIPFFHKNQLQGEYGNGEDDFWQVSEPLPKVVLTPSTPGILDKKESEIVVENNKNEENPRQKTPEIILSNTGGEILQNTTAEPLVYSRKRFHKRKNVQIESLAPSQSEEPNDGPQETQVITNPDLIFSSTEAQDSEVVDLDLPIAIRKGTRSCTTKHSIAKYLSYKKNLTQTSSFFVKNF